MPPRVSIVILNYNYERFLGAAIDCALAQTHPYTEVVVVDDGSTDNSRDVIARHGGQVTSVLQANGGQGSGMNAGFAATTGDVVVFLDADDLLDRTAAAVVADAFARQPATAWFMYRLRIIGGDGHPVGRVRPRRAGVMPNGDLRRHLARYRCFHWQPTTGNAFASAALRSVLPMPTEEYRLSADSYLAGVVPLCGPVRSTDRVLGSYRIHGSNNFATVAVDTEYFRTQIDRQVVTHGHAVEVARRLGVALPEDPRAPHDVAFLGFRLASLLLDPAGHPFPGETRAGLSLAGVRAALANPQLTWANRVQRAGWFATVGLLPTRLAARIAGASAPDTPTRRARLAARAVRRRGVTTRPGRSAS